MRLTLFLSLPRLIEILNLERELTGADHTRVLVETQAAARTRHPTYEVLGAVLVALEKVGHLVYLLEHERTSGRARQNAPLVVVVDEVVVVHDGEHDERVVLFVVAQLAAIARRFHAYVAVDVAESGLAVVRVGDLEAESGDELEEIVRVERAGEMKRLARGHRLEQQQQRRRGE